MKLVVTLPADVFRCPICFINKAAGRATFGEYKDHSNLLRHYRKLHDPRTTPVFECGHCGRRDARLKKLRAHLRICNAVSATPGHPGQGRLSMGHDAVSGALGHSEKSAGGRSQAGAPEASRTDRLCLELTYAAVLTRSSVVGSQAALPSPCVNVQTTATPRTVAVAAPASCEPCVRTPRRSGIPLPIRSATSAVSPRVPSASSGGVGSLLPTPAAERVAPASGAESGKSGGLPSPAPASAPSGVRWPRRPAVAGTSRPPPVESMGAGLGLPRAFATPLIGGPARRADSGRQAASLAATESAIIHGASAPLNDTPKAASKPGGPDGGTLVRSQTFTRIPAALPLRFRSGRECQ
ncbi:translation initiation factor IF-2-like [Schistocerca gregaria]|uniref:translation initiation factor IF-2-like n=1 Tax=Schistocerca gregaria TaxID=7010 RepID=UPI00211DA949|nr:translation initiation factor IF-2-like [Schistocerca gregaria]